MEPAVIIAAISLVTTLAMAFVSRGSQRSDKLEDRVGVLEARSSAHDTHIDNLKGSLDEIKLGMRDIAEKLNKALGLK